MSVVAFAPSRAPQQLSNPGAMATPAIPASTVPLVNPYGYPCLVTVRGGIVSAIAINGNAIGLLAGSFLLPAGGTITLAYVAPPAWDWFALA